MQTTFTEAQLQDPDTASSNQVLRTCVHCGFCTATCPTFVLLGDELDSPRGRIYLIKDMLESGRPATEEVVRHVDRCLSCLSCMSTCPSGVNYMHLVDHARHYIEQTYQRPASERALRTLLALILPRPRLFRLAMSGARLARPLRHLLPRTGILAPRLRAMLELAPARLPPAGDSARPQIHRAATPRRGRVALLTGCAQTVLDPAINEATIRLLTRSGIEVVVPRGIGCCGALTHHMGRHDSAMATARANIAAWTQEAEGEGLDAILINTSGCGTTVKDYGFMFRAEPEPWRTRAEKVSALAKDISEYLATIDYTPTRPAPGLRVAYHAACSLQHGQRVLDAPKTLLRRAGFTVVEPAEPHLCCGSAGIYNLVQPEIAGRLKARKLENIARIRPDLIAAGNIGCITQLAGPTPVIHTVQLLDWMAGGPPPPNLPPTAPRHRARHHLLHPGPHPRMNRTLATLLLLTPIAFAHPAAAQPAPTPDAPPGSPTTPPSPSTKPPAPAKPAATALLDQLKTAPDDTAASTLEDQLRTSWADAASPAVKLLLSRGMRELSEGATNDSYNSYDAALDLQPDLLEAWRGRASARLHLGDTVGAVHDLQEVIKREPRDFPAWQDLSRIAEARGDWRGALAAWQKLLEIDPRTPGAQDRLKDLRRRALGEDA